MQTAIEKSKLPSLQELIDESGLALKEKENQLMVILNQAPPAKWLSYHPIAKIKNDKGQDVPLPFLPIERVEYLLTAIYTKWWVEIRNVYTIANSCVVAIRLHVINPLTGEVEWQDGVGAAPIQTDKGAGAMDWNKAKSTGVQIAVPAAESYAVKDAAEKFGKMFGKDLARKEQINYETLLKTQSADISHDDLSELFELKKEALSISEKKDAERILSKKETVSYKKLHTLLKSK